METLFCDEDYQEYPTAPSTELPSTTLRVYDRASNKERPISKGTATAEGISVALFGLRIIITRVPGPAGPGYNRAGPLGL